MHILEETSFIKQLGYTAARLETFANRQFFEPFGLTISCGRVLYLLENLGPQTPTQLLKHIGGTKSNITQRLHTLERDGFIAKSEEPVVDKRSIIIKLTEKGKKQITELHAILHATSNQFDSQFTEEERSVCLSVLNKINRILDSQQDINCEKVCPHLKKSQV